MGRTAVLDRNSVNWDAAQGVYGKKVHTFARNSFYVVPGGEVEDMEQELLLVLWDCVQNYDPDRGASFNTFFQRSAVNRIISLKRHHETKGRKADVVSMDEESVRRVVEEQLTNSAEDQALARMDIRAYTLVHGTEGWDEDRQRRGGRRAAAS